MATRQEQREFARARRKAAEREAEQRRRRRRRAWQLGAVLGAAIAVIAVAVAVSSGSGGNQPTGLQPPSQIKRVIAELARIPQHGETLGQPSAPVTLRYYGDLECPYCRAFALQTLPTLIAGDVRSGRLKVQYVSLETATQQRQLFLTQQAAAYAAGLQDRAWYFIELFYLQQGVEDSGYVTPSFINTIAGQVPGLALARWQQDRGDPALAAQVNREQDQFATLGLQQSTPTLIVSGPKGTRGVQAFVTPGQMASLISAVA